MLAVRQGKRRSRENLLSALGRDGGDCGPSWRVWLGSEVCQKAVPAALVTAPLLTKFRDLVGLAYSALHSWEKFQLRRYEIRRDICVTCHDDHHPWYTCQYRIANAQHSYRRKLKAIAQGHKTIKAALTGGFAKLPAELRLQIFTYAFDRKWKYRVAYSWRSYSDQTPSADDNAIVVRPGYIPFTIRKSGLPFLETMQAWLSVNCVELNPRKRPWSSVRCFLALAWDIMCMM